MDREAAVAAKRPGQRRAQDVVGAEQVDLHGFAASRRGRSPAAARSARSSRRRGRAVAGAGRCEGLQHVAEARDVHAQRRARIGARPPREADDVPSLVAQAPARRPPRSRCWRPSRSPRVALPSPLPHQHRLAAVERLGIGRRASCTPSRAVAAAREQVLVEPPLGSCDPKCVISDRSSGGTGTRRARRTGSARPCRRRTSGSRTRGSGGHGTCSTSARTSRGDPDGDRTAGA